MNANDLEQAAIDWFKSGHATEEHWDELGAVLFLAGENDRLSSALENCIFNHACSGGASPEELYSPPT